MSPSPPSPLSTRPCRGGDELRTSSRAALAALALDVERMHGWREWHWWPDADPFEVIVGAILVQNTMWSNVERALDLLRTAGVLEPSRMVALSDEELEALVRPSGQFRQKAKKLHAFLALIDRHRGLDPLLALPPEELRTTLLGTWGIGKETADCIVLYAAREPAVIADAYLMRVLSRLGIGPVGSTSYDEWQAFVRDHSDNDRDRSARFHAEIVLHCKFLCRKRMPKCGECLLFDRCPGSPMRETAG